MNYLNLLWGNNKVPIKYFSRLNHLGKPPFRVSSSFFLFICIACFSLNKSIRNLPYPPWKD